MCASLLKVPTSFKPQSTSIPPDTIGRSYSADVLKRELQLILVLRENVSSITDAMFIQNEKAESLKGGLIMLLSKLRPPSSPSVSIRVDPGTGFQAVSKDPDLSSQGVCLEIGNAKNINKNPIAEKAIGELHGEISRLQPRGGAITEVTLALAIGNLNSRVRKGGLSAIEVWTQRDMNTGEQIPLSDRDLVVTKYKHRCESHQPSANYKSRGKSYSTPHSISVGDLVYLYQDRDKTKARDKYLVVKTQDSKIFIQKFTGSQLRAKEYTVDATDIIKVEPHKFHQYPLISEEESSDEGEHDDEAPKTSDPDIAPLTDKSSEESEAVVSVSESEQREDMQQGATKPKVKVLPSRKVKKNIKYPTEDTDSESLDDEQQQQKQRPKKKTKLKGGVNNAAVHVVMYHQ